MVRPAVVQRLEAVLQTLNKYVASSGDGSASKFLFLVDALTDEVIEELTDKDEAALEAYMQAMGEVIAWIGHGDASRLPEQVRMFAGATPELESSEV